jgi:hypothetical protein
MLVFAAVNAPASSQLTIGAAPKTGAVFIAMIFS